MKTYTFTLVLRETQATEKMADRLFECGCDDGLFGSQHGKVVVFFDREADSMEEAVSSAVRDVVSSGMQVYRLEMEDLAQLAGG